MSGGSGMRAQVGGRLKGRRNGEGEGGGWEGGLDIDWTKRSCGHLRESCAVLCLHFCYKSMIDTVPPSKTLHFQIQEKEALL